MTMTKTMKQWRQSTKQDKFKWHKAWYERSSHTTSTALNVYRTFSLTKNHSLFQLWFLYSDKYPLMSVLSSLADTYSRPIMQNRFITKCHQLRANRRCFSAIIYVSCTWQTTITVGFVSKTTDEFDPFTVIRWQDPYYKWANAESFCW